MPGGQLPSVYNTDQLDSDGDGVGDACPAIDVTAKLPLWEACGNAGFHKEWRGMEWSWDQPVAVTTVEFNVCGGGEEIDQVLVTTDVGNLSVIAKIDEPVVAGAWVQGHFPAPLLLAPDTTYIFWFHSADNWIGTTCANVLPGQQSHFANVPPEQIQPPPADSCTMDAIYCTYDIWMEFHIWGYFAGG